MRAFGEDGTTIVAEAEFIKGSGYTIMIYDESGKAAIGPENLSVESAARVLGGYDKSPPTL